MGAVQAKKIFQNERLVFALGGNTGNQTIITSEQVIGSPQTAWLRYNPYCCGGDEAYELTLKQPTSMINVITGVLIAWGNQAALIDGTIDDVVSKLNGCCGTNAVIVQNYGVTGLPARQLPVAKTYTLVRADDGTISAMTDAELAYSGDSVGERSSDALPNTFRFVSNDGASPPHSTYTFQAYNDPFPKGTDTITETARTFDSGNAPTLSGSNVQKVTGVADGVAYHVKGGLTTAATVILLAADAVTSLFGTWTVVSTHIHLSTTKKDVVTIVLDQEAP